MLLLQAAPSGPQSGGSQVKPQHRTASQIEGVSASAVPRLLCMRLR